MEWLINNPVANMPGTQFLIFFSYVVFFVVVTCWLIVRSVDKSKLVPPLQIPEKPKPYEIIYLRGKENEVIRLAIFNLINKGYLQLSTNYIEMKLEHPCPSLLPNIEKSLFAWISQQSIDLGTPITLNLNSSSYQAKSSTNGVNPEELFSTMATTIEKHCQPYKTTLEKNHLLLPIETKLTKKGISVFAFFLLLSLASYKLLVAIVQVSQENTLGTVFFLILFFFISVILLEKVCKVRHLTKRGQIYLKDLQIAFYNFTKNKELLNTRSEGYNSIATENAVAIFGARLLYDTTFNSFAKFFSYSNPDKNTGKVTNRTSFSSCGCNSSCSNGSCSD